MLQAKIESGEIKLKWDADFGYLPALLKALDVPVSSQLLVFSKTSLQRSFISPKVPRALYFNDNVYIGYIPEAPMIEVSEVDPRLGGVFYDLEQTAAYKPRFERNADCMQCHGGNRSLGIPGHIIRSIGTDERGEIDSQSEISEITHCTPLADRWAGWYVTGQHGGQIHRGNLAGAEAFEHQIREPNYLGNLSDVKNLLDTSNYLAPTSDIVAHLVLEHQSHMHNYVTRLRYETELMMATYGHIRYLDRQIDAFLRYLLFTEEAPLSEPIAGTAEFMRDFTARGPRDSKGRSLRDFDLQTRLFKYPCSFLIYTESFDQIPAVMSERIYQRLWDILNGRDAKFATLPEKSRNEVKEILLATKKGLPGYWHAPASLP
ncbi:MAG: Signal peptide protein [Chthoniobacteraceae bacterium]|nr:Signal peptide protein [Chthoniobacteraceae bacterium]